MVTIPMAMSPATLKRRRRCSVSVELTTFVCDGGDDRWCGRFSRFSHAQATRGFLIGGRGVDDVEGSYAHTETTIGTETIGQTTTVAGRSSSSTTSMTPAGKPPKRRIAQEPDVTLLKRFKEKQA